MRAVKVRGDMGQYEGQMDDINVVLALTNLAIGFSSLSKELHHKALEAIEAELEEIQEWSESEKRKAFLLAYKDYLDVSVHPL